MKTEYYTENRETLIGLIKVYEDKLDHFLDYEFARTFKLDELQQEWEYTEKLLDTYQGELLLLEAQKLLEVKDVSLPTTSLIKRIWRSFLHLITFY